MKVSNEIMQETARKPQRIGGVKETGMKTGTSRWLVLAVAGVLMAGVAGAQGFGGGQGFGQGFGNRRPPMQQSFGDPAGQKGWWNSPRMVERLKLTDDQRKAMDGIMLEHRERLIDLHANLEKAELAMQPLMSADTPNDAAITAQIDKVVQARGDLERANSRFLLAIRDKLTADQWKLLMTAREDDGMHGGDKREGWRRDGQGPGMQRPGAQGPGGQGPGGPGMQFRHRQMTPPQAPPPASPAPPSGSGSGSGAEQ
jgi:Spy/CpxP family protein refolding chaperone